MNTPNLSNEDEEILEEVREEKSSHLMIGRLMVILFSIAVVVVYFLFK